jgi:hypothetical protein
LYWTNPFSLILMSLSSLKPECFSEMTPSTQKLLRVMGAMRSF